MNREELTAKSLDLIQRLFEGEVIEPNTQAFDDAAEILRAVDTVDPQPPSTPKTVYRCRECGETDLWETVKIHVNTGAVDEGYGDQRMWCETCREDLYDDQVEAVTVPVVEAVSTLCADCAGMASARCLTCTRTYCEVCWPSHFDGGEDR